jgi:hypothetical protein
MNYQAATINVLVFLLVSLLVLRVSVISTHDDEFQPAQPHSAAAPPATGVPRAGSGASRESVHRASNASPMTPPPHRQLLPIESSWLNVLEDYSVPAFRTTYRKIHCGAVVRNLCLSLGQPRYFTPTGKLLTKSGATTVCNEAVRKPKLHMVMNSSVPAERILAPFSLLGGGGAFGVLIVPFCWELYGYHLLLCLMSTWATFQKSGLPHLMQHRRVVVKVGILKGSGLFSYLVGSRKSWDEPHIDEQDLRRSRPKPSYYWRLWSIIADTPDMVEPVGDIDPSCFDAGLLGGPPSTALTPAEQQEFKRELIRRLRLSPEVDAVNCGRVRITIIQRKARYKIKNIHEVRDALWHAFQRFGSVEVRTVELEAMPLLSQAELASNSDILVGIHGNGLSWSLLMPKNGVLLELWPNRAYNRNYPMFALRGNLYYVSSNGNGDCSARCSASFNVSAAAAMAREHLLRTSCQGLEFNTTPMFIEEKKRAEQRKLAKMRQRTLL